MSHYHVFEGMVGCIPDGTDTADTLASAQDMARGRADMARESGYPVRGNASRITRKGGVAYAYGRSGAFYIEIHPCAHGDSCEIVLYPDAMR